MGCRCCCSCCVATRTLGRYQPFASRTDRALRGAALHLDVARHFFPKEQVTQLLDLLAMHRFNTFHWHLVDDQGALAEVAWTPQEARSWGDFEQRLQGHLVRQDAMKVNYRRADGTPAHP